MTAQITDADRAAAHALSDEHDLCDWPSEDYHSAPCRDVTQAIADAREAATTAERSACVRELRARAAQASSDGWDMVENGLALAATRIELGVDR